MYQIGQQVTYNGKRAIVVRLPSEDFPIMEVEIWGSTVSRMVLSTDTVRP